MGCENCTEEIKRENERKNKIVELAQREANKVNEWFAIYTDNGQRRYIRADFAQGLPVEQYVSPKL